MHSIESNIELELIAGLIDGRLAGEDRARAMKLLANSDEALELFALALRQRHEMPDVGVVPIASRRRWPQWKLVVPIAAAAALAIVVLPTLRDRGASPPSAREYAMELGQDPRFVNELPKGWEQRAWAGTRGAGSNREASASTLAFRLGVRSVDLQVALQRGDTAVAGRLIEEILETLDDVALSAPVAARYAALRSGSRATLAPKSSIMSPRPSGNFANTSARHHSRLASGSGPRSWLHACTTRPSSNPRAERASSNRPTASRQMTAKCYGRSTLA